MKKYTALLFIALSSISITSMAASQANSNDACSITVYEKTPECYVSSDGSGCLTISNSKPKCSKGKCTIAIPGCTTKREY